VPWRGVRVVRLLLVQGWVLGRSGAGVGQVWDRPADEPALLLARRGAHPVARAGLREKRAGLRPQCPRPPPLVSGLNARTPAATKQAHFTHLPRRTCSAESLQKSVPLPRRTESRPPRSLRRLHFTAPACGDRPLAGRQNNPKPPCRRSIVTWAGRAAIRPTPLCNSGPTAAPSAQPHPLTASRSRGHRTSQRRPHLCQLRPLLSRHRPPPKPRSSPGSGRGPPRGSC
jgi:hypothetical protein